MKRKSYYRPSDPIFSNDYLTCKDCKKVFRFSIEDQEFYAEKHFTPPKRCHKCREIYKAGLAQNRAK